jgi:hypothetical protein
MALAASSGILAYHTTVSGESIAGQGARLKECKLMKIITQNSHYEYTNFAIYPKWTDLDKKNPRKNREICRKSI